MIKRLSEITSKSRETVGGKAANLGELYKNGFNVPDGFVIPVDVYYDFLSKNEIKGKIDAKLKRMDTSDIEDLEKISVDIRLLFDAAFFPGAVEEQIRFFLKELAPVHAAVRSSATCEDLMGASFAGQYETYLDIPHDEVITHIKCCYASLFTPRAIVYREIKKFTHDVGMAVLIQEMVPSEFAGVLFTVDPLKKKNILVELASGSGENVVSGNISPNNYFVDRETFEIKECCEREEFNQETVKQIARIGLEIEKHFSYPQDIEFALANKEIFILQARPITTL